MTRLLRSTAWMAVITLAAGCARGTSIVSAPENKGTIVGRVLEVPSGAPLAGATITTSPDVGTFTTDATGHFTITDLPLEAEYRVTASKTGHLSQSVDVPVTRQQTWISVELTLLRF